MEQQLPSPYYRVSVKAITLNEHGEILLAREENGYWELIGGGLDHNEDPATGLRREIAEETGLSATWISPTPKYFITAGKFNGINYTANIIYEVKLANLNFTPSEECVELKYFSLEEAKKLQAYPNVTAFLAVFDPKLHI